MFGAILGDIIGSRFERNNIKTKDFELFGPGCHVTDDSIMTIAVAQALLNTDREAPGDIQQRIIDSMTFWGRENIDAGFGGKFRQWLLSDDHKPYGSFGNGSAMRVSPVAWFATSLEETLRLAEMSAEVSHNHPEAVKGAQCTAAVIFLARAGWSKAKIKDYVKEYFYPNAFDKTSDELRPTFEFDVSCQGTMPAALVAFMEGDSFEDVIRIAVSLGGDSDTIAAIAGSMAEGFYKIPDELKEKAYSYMDMTMRSIVGKFEAAYME